VYGIILLSLYVGTQLLLMVHSFTPTLISKFSELYQIMSFHLAEFQWLPLSLRLLCLAAHCPPWASVFLQSAVRCNTF